MLLPCLFFKHQILIWYRCKLIKIFVYVSFPSSFLVSYFDRIAKIRIHWFEHWPSVRWVAFELTKSPNIYANRCVNVYVTMIRMCVKQPPCVSLNYTTFHRRWWVRMKIEGSGKIRFTHFTYRHFTGRRSRLLGSIEGSAVGFESNGGCECCGRTERN